MEADLKMTIFIGCANPLNFGLECILFVYFHTKMVFLNFMYNLFGVHVCFINLCRRLIRFLKLHVKKFHLYLSSFTDICLGALFSIRHHFYI